MLPGTFETSGYGPGTATNWYLRKNTKLIGSGMQTTTLRLVAGVPGNMLAVKGSGDDIEVTDLTVDGNTTNSPSAMAQGVHIEGSRCAIRRVRLVNPAAPTGSECWGLRLDAGSYGILEDNEISRVHGSGQMTCFATLWTTNAIMRYNRVIGPGDSTNIWAFNHAWSFGLLIQGNYTERAFFAVYGDTGSYQDGMIVNNQLKNCEFAGVHFIPTMVVSNYAVINNDISVAITNHPTYIPPGISFYCPGHHNSWEHNQVRNWR